MEVLLRAAYMLRKAVPDIEFRIVGDGPERKRLRGICRELDLEPAVQWLGDVSISRLAEEYNRCDVFCLPSVQEGFGIVFLEAMAAGKPIVAVRAAAVPEVVRHGILAKPDDPNSLADGILRLYRDAGLRHSLGAAGLRDVERFEMSRVVRHFLSEIARVAPNLDFAESEWTMEAAKT